MQATNKQDLPADNGTVAEPLFANVRVSFVLGRDLDEDRSEELEIRIERNGGVVLPRIDVDQTTHIIATTSDFPEYGAAVDAMISVVKPEWVMVTLAKNKLAQIRPYSPDPRLFFAGVTICCADLPPGDKDAIVGGVVAMGGQYSGHLSKVVTHIVALTEQHEKCQQALTRKLPCSIVLPHWFDDCLRLGRRIDEGPYKLPNPEITRVDSKDPVRLPSDHHLTGASSPRAGPLPVTKPAGSVRSDLNVFRGKKVMLSNQLDLGSRLRGTIEDVIVSGGGTVTGSVHKADIFVCHDRDHHDFRVASRAGKHVGNLPWLYYLITHNAWTSPLRRLLHYPVARAGLPGFDRYRISLSNYGGEARLYLENLIVAAGAEFTKTLRQDNTHLITARPHSEKCDAAREWNIHLVNHLWLEESYARWEEQSFTNQRYTHFPPRTNLGEVVGQTQINRSAMEAIFIPPDEAETTDDDKAGASPPAQVPPPAAIKMPMGEESRPTKFHPSKTQLGMPRSINGPKSPPMTTKAAAPTPTTTLAVRGPQFERSKVQVDKRPRTPLRASLDRLENQTPSTTGSRGAKDRAMARLHDLAPDIALYEKEKRRVGGVVHGGKRSTTEASIGMKRSLSREVVEDGSSDLADSDPREVKRRRKSQPQPASPSMKLLITGYQRWVGPTKLEEEDKRRLRKHGIAIVQEPSQCSHLAAPAMIRTQKFITALAYGPVVLSTDFVTDCLSHNQVPEVNEYLLQDETTEKRLGIKLRDSLSRARKNARTLLRDVVVYCTPTVHGGVDTYQAIVEANGGRCLSFRPRQGGPFLTNGTTSKSVPSTGPSNHDDDLDPKDDDDANGKEIRYVYLLSGETAEERKLWSKFRQMVKASGGGGGVEARIVRTEWILDVAMSQDMKWRNDYRVDDS